MKTQLIPAVERELADISGVETLISKLRNEPWLKGRKESAIFHAERALAYMKEGKLIAVEQYGRIGEKRAFFDLVVMEDEREVIVEVKNWRGWSKWNEDIREERLARLEEQIERYARGGRFIRLEFRSFVPDEIVSSRILLRLIVQGKLEIKIVL